MSDYGFIHEGRVFTPNGTADIPVEANAERNAAIEAAELAAWDGQPDRMLAYYHFPAGTEARVNRFAELRRTSYAPCLWGETHEQNAYVSTWPGTRIGTITSARVYRHNFGGRFVAITVRGTNGATYHGRASWDGGSCVWLRKAKGR